VAFGTAIGLLLVECMLRAGVLKTRHYYYLTPAGQRSRPRGKLMILGDSFVAKGGPLDALLLKQLGPYRVAVWNFGKAGTGPLDALVDVQENVRSIRPNVVMMCLFVGNDITDTERSLSSHESKTGLRRLLRPLLRRLYLYRFLRFELTSGRRPKIPKDLSVDPQIIELYRRGRIPNPGWLLASDFEKSRLVRDNLFLDGPGGRRAADAVEGAIREVHRLCQEVGAKMLLVAFPCSFQVNRDGFDFFQRLGVPIDDRALETDLPQRRWKAVGESLEVPVVDMLAEFRSRRSQNLYLENDMHFNKAGNALAADLMVQSLVELIPQVQGP
jgi:hypothetical protein